MTTPCAGCGLELLPEEEARYDVYSESPSDGPFCADCFSGTATGKLIASKPTPDTVDPEERK